MSIIDLSQPTLLTTTSVVNFGLAFLAIAIGAIVYLRDRKSTVNQLFLMIALNLGFWTFSSTMADVSREYSSALFWARAAFVGPLFFAPFFLLFSYYFPKRSGDVSLTKILLIFAPCAIATVFVPTPANIVSIALMDWGTDFTPGPLYIYLFAYMTICSALAARHFYIVYKKTDDAMVKKQITMAFLGLALVVASGLVTNLVLPVIFKYSRASVIGPAASLFFVVLIMYAILRHGLLNTKVIAAEIFSGALVFLSFVDVFTAGSVGQYLYRGVVFLITLLIALLLVKSVTAEVRRREELHELSQKLAVANEHLKEMDQL